MTNTFKLLVLTLISAWVLSPAFVNCSGFQPIDLQQSLDSSTQNTSDPLHSIDTGKDPVFSDGAIGVAIQGSTINITATRDVQTAAGIYNSDGVLVRTLWRKRNLTGGETTRITWDFKDDFGMTLPDGSYDAKVIAHNVFYQWQGVIGNTSHPGAEKAFDIMQRLGDGKLYPYTVVGDIYRSFMPMASMAISSSGAAFIGLGYNEGQYSLARATIGNQLTFKGFGVLDFQRSIMHVATDDITVYAVNVGVHGSGIFDHPENFILGYKTNTNSLVNFSGGMAWTSGLSAANRYDSVIDVVSDGVDKIKGLAVEKNGTNLYVSHVSGIKILNKTTGECKTKISTAVCATNISVPNAGPTALSPQGDLWVVSNETEIRKYTNPTGSPTLALTIKGSFSRIVALGVSPMTSTLIVVDAGANQQIKGYNTQTGALSWVQGVQGGYNLTNGPDVSTQKFNFGRPKINDYPSTSFVAFEPSNTEEIFWVGEQGNFRNIKFKIPAVPAKVNPLIYVDQIMYIASSYNTSVDGAQPTRVFNKYLEFAVDYSKPIQNSWTLVKNWDINLPQGVESMAPNAGPDPERFDGFKSVYTTPQGRTYGMIAVKRQGGEWRSALVELTTKGLRDTGVDFPMEASLYEDMNIRYPEESGGRYKIIQHTFQDIDTNGNPLFTDPFVVASAPLRNSMYQNPYHGPYLSGANEARFPKTSSNRLITFDPCLEAVAGYNPSAHHLGGIPVGGTDYAFRAAPGGAWVIENETGRILRSDADGTFNLENQGTPNAGGKVVTAGRNIIWGYFGEFFNSNANPGQANQWVHYLDNGLFIGQFGVASYNFSGKDAIPVGTAGNTFSPAMVTVDGNYYLYFNDEAAHAGTHRWRIANFNSIQESVGHIGKGVTVTNPQRIDSKPIQH